MKKKSFAILIILVFHVLAVHAQVTQNPQNPTTIHATEGSYGVKSGVSFSNFTEVSPFDSVFLTPPSEDFKVLSMEPADYDNDGDLDIAVIGQYVWYYQAIEHRLMLMRNDGFSGDSWIFTYITLEAENLLTESCDLAWGDADGDGDLDLVVGSGGLSGRDGTTYLFMNEAGILTSFETNLPGYVEDNSLAHYDMNSISWADYDNDGDMDLLIPSVYDDTAFAQTTKLMRNDGTVNGQVVFTATDPGIAGTVNAQTFWADCDNDHDPDLLVNSMDPYGNNAYIRQYINNGDGTFSPDDILGSLIIEHGQIGWGDYDNDGDLDILVAGNLMEANGSNTLVNLRIYRNQGNGYDTVNIIPYANCDWDQVFGASWADYDSDGDMDILLAGSYNSGNIIEGRVRILINENSLFVTLGEDLPAPVGSGGLGGAYSWFDLDNDGDLDYCISGCFVVSGGSGPLEWQMHLYRNDCPMVNLAPSSPEEITVVPQSENSVLLSWESAYDDHTSTASLTYDVKLFSKDILVNTPARLPYPGNSGATNQWLLQNLPDGEYQYSIQAVDASFTGSTAATGQFTIGTIPVQSLPAIPNFNASAFPNPAEDYVSITFSLPVTSQVYITLTDLTGKQLITLPSRCYAQGTHCIRLELSNLPKGLYLYKIAAEENFIAGKIVVTN